VTCGCAALGPCAAYPRQFHPIRINQTKFGPRSQEEAHRLQFRAVSPAAIFAPPTDQQIRHVIGHDHAGVLKGIL
jgi:putative NADH-flavin reductase